MATFDSESIEFLDPEDVIAPIKGRLSDPETVVKALAGKLDPHGDAVCPSGQTVGCGILRPDLAAVIFDESRYRVYLFVAPSLLRTLRRNEASFLESPQRVFSSVNRFRFHAHGGGIGEDFSHQLLADGDWAYGRTRLSERIRLDSEFGADVEKLSLSHVGNHWMVEAGSFSTAGAPASLISSRDMLGVRVAASLAMRTDVRAKSSNDITVFLDERSRVELVKDGKVMSSAFYEAGNQSLDTSALPDGAYTVEVRINDSRGRRIEHRYFTRSMAIPPRNFAGHFIEAGRLIRREAGFSPFFDHYQDNYLSMGTRLRLSDRVGTEVQMATTDFSGAFGQIGFLQVSNDLNHRLGIFVADKGLAGIIDSIMFSRKNYSVSLDYRSVRDMRGTRKLASQGLLATSLGRELRVGFSLRVLNGTVIGDFRTSSTGYQQRNEGFVSYRYPLFQRYGVGAALSFRINYRNREPVYYAGFTLSRAGKNWRTGVTAASSSAPGAGREARFSVRRQLVDAEGVRMSGAFFSSLGDANRQLGARFSGTTRYADGSFDFSGDLDSGGFSPSYALEINSSLLTSGKHLALSGGSPATSGLIATIHGDGNDKFDVVINGNVRGVVSPGKSLPLFLAPFGHYQVYLRDKGSSLYALDSEPKSVVVLPGNVANLRWDVQHVSVLVSRALNGRGEPLSNARFKNVAEFSVTDEDGRFQVELSGQKTLFLEMSDGGECKMIVPERASQDALVVVENMICD